MAEAEPGRRKTGAFYRKVECVCRCGKKKTFILSNLGNGKTRSCGCLSRELRRSMAKHGACAGDQESRTYRAWIEMKVRCSNKNKIAWQNYGGRGIQVCDRWLHSFENFLADMGECPSDRSLDRIDNGSGYSKDNCRWATKVEQNNNKRSNRWFEHDGKRMTIGQWGRYMGWPKWVIYNRIDSGGMSFKEAITTPLRNPLASSR